MSEQHYILRLYITGRSVRSERAIANLSRICRDDLEGCYSVEIIDVLEHPQLAEDERILATPLLVKRLPLPLRRVIGDFSDREKVLLGLDLRTQDGPASLAFRSPADESPSATSAASTLE